ncbi:MAG: leucyl aminopeptidase [Gammaproteobacteria bacterium]|nr:leucyl aminopeptidase [Gammaproteobacteria bacterium]MBI5618476.1 leucyl aminopeptidase [Gammaproteobacteria bacterium]
MEISIKRGTPASQKAACIVVGVHTGKHLSPSAAALDKTMRGAISRILKRGDLSGKCGETLLLPEAPGAGPERVLLVGAGKAGALDASDFMSLVQKTAAALGSVHGKTAVTCLSEIEVKERDLDWRVRQEVLALHAAAYRFDQMKSKPKPAKGAYGRIGLLVAEKHAPAATEALATAKALVAGLELTKTLANLPGNHCPPSHLADAAEEIGKAYEAVEVTVLEQADMEKLGMGSLLSVSRGSRQPPKLITLEYAGGAADAAPVVLVGKGVTFDSGGISLKPGAAMDEMKFDMAGAASVLGCIKACAELALPLNVVGVIPATENLPDGNATKPGDVVTSMSGQTIEILNTDAEGRLILCDALTYSKKFNPDVVIDIATLTGACVIALGSHASGLMSNNDKLAEDLLEAGTLSGDRAWRLPLWEDYQKQLDTPFADMANVGGREAGTITAACFLWRFTKDYRWAHLDIAGTAWKSKPKGATGRPLPLLMEYLLARAAKA